MSERKHPTRVIYHHDPASLPAELHEQYEVRQAPRVDTVRGPTIVIDDGGPSIILGEQDRPPSILLTDTVFGDVGPGVIPLPLPEYLNRPGRLVRDDAARGWRFEPAVRDE